MKKVIKNPLSIKIKALREERNLTHQQLADLTGLAKPLISMIENGDRFPSEDVLQKLCTAFNVTEADILTEEVKTQALEQLKDAEPRDVLTAYRKIYRG